MRSGAGVDIYQHDSATAFRFVLRGELSGAPVLELEQAWATAASVIKDKELVVDVRRLSGTDAAGAALLARMRQSGARFIAAAPGQSGRAGWLPRLLVWRASVKYR